MSLTPEDRLYSLLPAIYRLRDDAQGQPLRVLLGVLEQELLLVEQDIDQLYDNWFIETCAEWVVPYLGDLLGVRNLHALSGSIFSQRAYVANTLAYRRRKGTASVMERLARDITGWPAVAVECFERLGATQYMNHVRPGLGGTVDVHPAGELELSGGPFDRAAHTTDVRHIDNGRGRYNIPNLGLFLWRLTAYPSQDAAPASLGAKRYTFHPLGYDAPLFNPAQTAGGFSTGLTELNVPGQLRRRPLYDELAAGAPRSPPAKAPWRATLETSPRLSVYAVDRALEPEEILVCDLSTWAGRSARNCRGRPEARPIGHGSQSIHCWADCSGSTGTRLKSSRSATRMAARAISAAAHTTDGGRSLLSGPRPAER